MSILSHDAAQAALKLIHRPKDGSVANQQARAIAVALLREVAAQHRNLAGNNNSPASEALRNRAAEYEKAASQA
jgi:hypothetical protein